jgi:hypothetical protein
MPRLKVSPAWRATGYSKAIFDDVPADWLIRKIPDGSSALHLLIKIP